MAALPVTNLMLRHPTDIRSCSQNILRYDLECTDLLSVEEAYCIVFRLAVHDVVRRRQAGSLFER